MVDFPVKKGLKVGKNVGKAGKGETPIWKLLMVVQAGCDECGPDFVCNRSGFWWLSPENSPEGGGLIFSLWARKEVFGCFRGLPSTLFLATFQRIATDE